MIDPADLERLTRALYDFGEAESMAAGEEGHGPWEECPPGMQDFCRRLTAHIVEEWGAILRERLTRFAIPPGAADVDYPVPANQTRKDVN